MHSKFIRSAIVAGLAAILGVAVHASARADDAAIWDGIRNDLFGTREIVDGAGKIALEAPYRAEDASTVPISIRMPADFAKGVKALTLVIDKNPSPVVATFTYGDAAGTGERILATRVRIDQYSERPRHRRDGRRQTLYGDDGSSKPRAAARRRLSKDAEEAAKTMGKMRVKTAFKDPERRRHSGGRGHDQASEQFGHADGSGDRALHARAFRRQDRSHAPAESWSSR